MKKALFESFIDLLRQELMPALGCTEPISIAYACARAREELGGFPEHMEVHCSGNVIKNVRCVTVPNSGGQKGIKAAAILGAAGGASGKALEVLESVTDEDRETAKKLSSTDFCRCVLKKGVDNLYVEAKLYRNGQSAEVTIVNRHTLITKIVQNGETVFELPQPAVAARAALRHLTVKNILEFAREVDTDAVKDIFERQIQMNNAISEEGLRNPYGARVGATILKTYGNGVIARARAKSAAGSDARMSGCSLPVVINSGSGNQGITVSIPVAEYAAEMGASREELYRALAVSNLVAIHQKRYIGSLSAYCGAVSAACGAGAGLTFLHGGGYEAVGRTIINTIANVGGILCDGAKPSCAAKIASSVEAAIMAHHLSLEGKVFLSGEGLVCENLEETIKSIGYIGRVGMKSTDTKILKLLSEKNKGG